MISFFEASIKNLSIHWVGNKSQDEQYVLSEKPYEVNDDMTRNLLMHYLLGRFESVEQTYHFYHPSNDLDLNEVYGFAQDIFERYRTFGADKFHTSSQDIAMFLHEVSGHPKIKSGEIIVALLENVQIEGELLDAIGIFKVEHKENFLKISPNQSGFEFTHEQEGISIYGLQKGCLIFNTNADTGYKVAVLDQKKANDAIYWKDEFLGVRVINNEYNQTSTALSVFKSFVADHIDQEFEISKTEKIDLLNNSIKYFKDKEVFDLQEFSHEVIGNEAGIALFQNYSKSFQEDFESPIPENFDISESAVKRQSKSYKSTLKLDKNFQINISGDKDLIEKGFDDEKSMNYYKVYFREEV